MAPPSAAERIGCRQQLSPARYWKQSNGNGLPGNRDNERGDPRSPSLGLTWEEVCRTQVSVQRRDANLEHRMTSRCRAIFACARYPTDIQQDRRRCGPRDGRELRSLPGWTRRRALQRELPPVSRSSGRLRCNCESLPLEFGEDCPKLS